VKRNRNSSHISGGPAHLRNKISGKEGLQGVNKKRNSFIILDRTKVGKQTENGKLFRWSIHRKGGGAASILMRGKKTKNRRR